MTRIERRLLVRSSLLGFVLTLLVLIADWRGRDGLLARLENNLYDLRARHFQFFTPPPTDKLVHVDIDDPSLQYMGQWPWPRALLAELTDVMRESGAKAVAFDVLFSEREPTTLRRKVVKVSELVPTKPGEPRRMIWKERETIEEVDGNVLFADSLRRFGAAILPASYEPRSEGAAESVAIYRMLFADLLLTRPKILQLLAEEGHLITEPAEFDARYRRALNEAMFDRITRLLETTATGQEKQNLDARAAAAETLFGMKESQLDAHFPPGLFKQQFDKAVAFRLLRRFARPLPPDLPGVIPTTPSLSPTPTLSEAAGGSSYVNYLSDRDGVVRTVELWRECDGWLHPQFGLMLACAYLGTDIGRIELHDDHIIIPKPDGTQLVVPAFSQHVPAVGRKCAMHLAVPWFGPSDRPDSWARMYDYPRNIDSTQHLSMLKVWEVLRYRDKVRANTAQIRKTIAIVFELTNEQRSMDFAAVSLDPDDVAAHVSLLNETLARRDEIDFILNGADKLSGQELEKWLQDVPAEDRSNIRSFVELLQAAPGLRDDTMEMAALLPRLRTGLRNQLQNKALIVGFTATGRTDVVPTPMVAHCPGPVVHGVVFNAIMTGDLWTVASPWVTRLFTLLVGLLATGAVAYFHPLNAMLTSLAIAAGYAALNFIYLFDHGNFIVGAAAPLVSVGLVWSGCTLMRFIVERADRRRIEGRFRGYVDSALVDAIVENPEKVHFEGESREMTVVFTDLAGFTTISETLKARTVPILNEYMRRMVTIIRSEQKPRHRRGYRNKFLGDGIMFFFGAPWENSSHAIDAVETVLNMQQAMPQFNAWLKDQDLPPVQMRAGISTGEMIVGDAGTQGAADYTVLGDDVNFGARLESANKAVGTLVMISQRTKELCDAVFLCRPIARLQVVGKTTGIKVYEPLNYRDQATEVQKTLAKASETMVDLFTRGDFAGCIRHLQTMDDLFGPTKLTALYRRECERYLAEPPGEAFDGTIVLAEK